MEERKKRGPLGILGLILLFIILMLACYLSMGLSDLSLGLGSWGLYTTDENSLYLASAYLETDTRDLLICDRRVQPQDGSLVTYQLNGQRTVDFYDDLLGRPVLAIEGSYTTPEPVTHILRDGGRVLYIMHQWRWCIWGFTAGLFTVLLVNKLTADARWRKRQQKLMLKNFQTYGDKYEQEEEDMAY